MKKDTIFVLFLFIILHIHLHLLPLHLLLRFVSLPFLIRPVSLRLFAFLLFFSIIIVLCLISCLFPFSYSFLPCSSFFMFLSLPAFIIFLHLLILFLCSFSSKSWPAHFALMVLTLNCWRIMTYEYIPKWRSLLQCVITLRVRSSFGHYDGLQECSVTSTHLPIIIYVPCPVQTWTCLIP